MYIYMEYSIVQRTFVNVSPLNLKWVYLYFKNIQITKMRFLDPEFLYEVLYNYVALSWLKLNSKLCI